LIERIDATIAAAREKARLQQKELPQDGSEHQKRIQRFEQVREEIRALARPRIEALARQFGDQVQITPKVTQSRSAVTFDFKAPGGYITLSFSVVPDEEVKNAVIEYNLEVVPVRTMYDSHAEFRAPIDGFNPAALESWVDDWIVRFVEHYMQMHEIDAGGHADHVEDPVVKVRFPKFAAGATLEHEGRTYYFIDDRTRDDFARQNGVKVS
jgi:hypothetical protein